MQITLFSSAPDPQTPAEAAAAAFFSAVDYKLLGQQRQWLNRTLDHKAVQDRPGRRLLRFLDTLCDTFNAQGGELSQKRQYWQAVHEMKNWLLAKVDFGRAEESPGMGLLHLLDAVQDFATDTLGVPEHYVFPGLRVTIQAEQLSYSRAA